MEWRDCFLAGYIWKLSKNLCFRLIRRSWNYSKYRKIWLKILTMWIWMYLNFNSYVLLNLFTFTWSKAWRLQKKKLPLSAVEPAMSWIIADSSQNHGAIKSVPTLIISVGTLLMAPWFWDDDQLYDQLHDQL